MNVFCYEVKLSDHFDKDYEPLLSKNERKIALLYQLDDLKKRYITGRGILRSILEKTLNKRATEIEIFLGPQGKPLVEGVYFNISHSIDQMIICTCFHADLGVDIEKINPSHWSYDLEDYLFSSKEKAHANELNLDSRISYFFSVWTRKEAIFKYLGIAIQTQLLNQIDTESKMDWEITPLSVNQFYKAHVATKKNPIQIHYLQYQ